MKMFPNKRSLEQVRRDKFRVATVLLLLVVVKGSFAESSSETEDIEKSLNLVAQMDHTMADDNNVTIRTPLEILQLEYKDLQARLQEAELKVTSVAYETSQLECNGLCRAKQDQMTAQMDQMMAQMDQMTAQMDQMTAATSKHQESLDKIHRILEEGASHTQSTCSYITDVVNRSVVKTIKEESQSIQNKSQEYSSRLYENLELLRGIALKGSNMQQLLTDEKSRIAVIAGQVYVMHRKSMKWQAAHETCKSLHMKLVSVQTVEKWHAIKDYMNGIGMEINFWTSGRRGGRGIWTWSATGEPFTFTSWFPGQPDEFGDVCVLFHPNVGWYDQCCKTATNVMCE